MKYGVIQNKGNLKINKSNLQLHNRYFIVTRITIVVAYLIKLKFMYLNVHFYITIIISFKISYEIWSSTE